MVGGLHLLSYFPVTEEKKKKVAWDSALLIYTDAMKPSSPREPRKILTLVCLITLCISKGVSSEVFLFLVKIYINLLSILKVYIKMRVFNLW